MERAAWVLLAGAVVALGALGVKTAMDMPRGIRNNNPGNIRRTGERWVGMSPVQSDPDFVVFEQPQFGIRALTRTLKNYQKKHGLDTVREIINRYAPPVENDTSAYVLSVANRLGVHPDDRLNLNDRDTMERLVVAIIKHENGQVPYNVDTINMGIAMA